MNAAPAILLLAPQIPQVYVALALIPRLRERLPACRFLLATREEHRTLAATGGAEVVPEPARLAAGPAPPGLCAVVFVGHSYFLEEATLGWAAGLSCPAYWVNAHWEEEDLAARLAGGSGRRQLATLFREVFYDEPGDGAGLLGLGFAAGQIHHVGNAKYDCARPEDGQVAAAREILRQLGGLDRPIVAAGSFVAGAELDLLIAAFAALWREFPDLLLVLAPRRSDHLPLARQALEEAGIAYAASSCPGSREPGRRVLLVDQTGLLKGFYAWCQVAVLGRSFIPSPAGARTSSKRARRPPPS